MLSLTSLCCPAQQEQILLLLKANQKKVSGPSKAINEATEDLTNLADHGICHWGDNEPKETQESCR